jgi:hypothetical protein
MARGARQDFVKHSDQPALAENARQAQSRNRLPSLPRERLRLLAHRIHILGERPLFELLVELNDGKPFIERVEAYARLAPLVGFIRALDGDTLPPPRIVRARR